jgi:hypothetical protein
LAAAGALQRSVEAEAEDYMRMAREKAVFGEKKGILGFGPALSMGTGVSYASAVPGAQTYSANALVR